MGVAGGDTEAVILRGERQGVRGEWSGGNGLHEWPGHTHKFRRRHHGGSASTFLVLEQRRWRQAPMASSVKRRWRAAPRHRCGGLRFVSLPQHGALHGAPPYGSAWQYLASGEKVWFALANNTFSLQSFAGATKAPDMASLSLLHACYRVVIRPGDFVSVPMAWAHAVDTRTAAIGLSGYSASTMLRPRSPEAEDY